MENKTNNEKRGSGDIATMMLAISTLVLTIADKINVPDMWLIVICIAILLGCAILVFLEIKNRI